MEARRGLGPALGAAALLAALAACGPAPDEPANNPPPAPEEVIDPLVASRPAGETAFIALVDGIGEAADKDFPNPIQEAASDKQLLERFCAQAKQLSVLKDWVGHISVQDERGSVFIQLDKGLRLDADIPTTSPLFATLAAMRQDQPVRFSGVFDQADVADFCSPRHLSDPDFTQFKASTLEISFWHLSAVTDLAPATE